jgi:NAD(P)-dependent dehydrogenase (short-subunit alcohol dehydrogenase family)
VAGYSLKGKVAIVTGGSRGLGYLIARNLCVKGANVVLLARSVEELMQAKAELDDLGTEVFVSPCNLLDREQIRATVSGVLARFGKIDIVVNNAGIIEVGPLAHMQREDFERAMNLHFWAPYELIQEVLPVMRQQGGGRIVNIASIGGRVAVPHMAPYTASKFALVGLSDSFRTELARENIFVTTVTPGLMRTGSEVHARFKGDHAAEFEAFSAASKVPLASISAERAARKIVSACRRGSPTLVMPFSARLLIAANGVFPSLTGRIMALINSFLPPPVGRDGDQERAGADIR